MSRLNVLYQFDENYAPFAGVSITSLLERNREIEELTVYLAVKDISKQTKEKLSSLAGQYQRSFVFLNTDHIYQKLMDMGANTWNGSLATWMKMFVAGDIPEEADQLLYVDSDTIITGSLRELAELDLKEYPVGAVIDSISPYSQERLKLKSPYFNAGIIYFNLKYWRENGTQGNMLSHLERHIHEYPVNDQDLLNDYFRDRIYRLDPRFNFQGTHFFYKDQDYFPAINWKPGAYYSPNEISAARKDIRVIHFFRFCGEYPWQPGNIHPCQSIYEEAKQQSLWKDNQQPAAPLKGIYKIEKILYRILPKKLFFKLTLRFAN